ncbi:cilia- and flagella-associated protein 65-like [Tenebrio molitor]|uniref:cilia- and flagella-associated protein 65-like n=1 Tax=Tenebrio molitor TaxID=7067 RepID=UPI003624A737
MKHVFDLTKNSRVPAIFQFDCGVEEQRVFVVAPRNGTIRPQQHQYITAKFLPQTPRFYAKQLCCLVLYYEPILLNLFGIFSTEIDYDPEVSFRYYSFPYEETVGFQGYSSDSVTLKHVLPPVSLSVNYLDFGQIMPEGSCQTMTTSFTNHMRNEVEVEWENAALFRIYPEKLGIPPKQSALYKIRFKPDSTCRLLSAILNGHVSWTLSDNEFPTSLNVPIPITLRLIGHSFPKNQSWIPSISIVSNTVILPLTLPNFPSWTMFMRQSHGQHVPIKNISFCQCMQLQFHNFLGTSFRRRRSSGSTLPRANWPRTKKYSLPVGTLRI